MKLIAALVISASVFFGVAVSGVAGLTLTTAGTCIDVQDAAVGGVITAITNAPPLIFDLNGACP